MSNLFASIFTGFGAFFSGLLGHGHPAMNQMVHPAPNAAFEASTTMGMHGMPMMGMMRDGIFGIVEATDGTTITVDGHQGTSTAATTTYSVDAENAKIIKGPATSTASVSDISVGDHVVVLGPVASDDSIAATIIIDGKFPMMMGGRGFGQPGMATSTRGYGGRMWNASGTPPWQGMQGTSTRGMPPRGQGSSNGYNNEGGMNPGGPMQGGPMPGMHMNGQVQGQAGAQGGPGVNVGAGANVNVNVGGGY